MQVDLKFDTQILGAIIGGLFAIFSAWLGYRLTKSATQNNTLNETVEIQNTKTFSKSEYKSINKSIGCLGLYFYTIVAPITFLLGLFFAMIAIIILEIIFIFIVASLNDTNSLAFDGMKNSPPKIFIVIITAVISYIFSLGGCFAGYMQKRIFTGLKQFWWLIPFNGLMTWLIGLVYMGAMIGSVLIIGDGSNTSVGQIIGLFIGSLLVGAYLGILISFVYMFILPILFLTFRRKQ